ncbi:MAG TPA: hypothetical protein VNX18_02330 [Bryobacteraceae bacterium]|nr:hypothetical protein [Bryobacteraceae bacterium]
MIRAKLALFLCAGAAFAQSHEAALKNLKFRNIGPAIMGGRVDDFAVVESDPRVIYVGSAAGGIFKTINAGVTWEPIFDQQPNPSIGDIALAPSNPAILYVGTGEPNNRQSSSWGAGVFKSMDAGHTWNFIGLKDTHHIGRIVVHPADQNIVYVAALGDLWGPNKDRGVFKSTDGGATWTQALSINDDTGVSDIAIDPQSPNIIFAAAYERRRTVFGYNGGGPDGGIYRSIDAGAHWAKLANGLPATGDYGRCALDIARKNTNVVYALIEHRTLGGVYRSENKGESWTRMSETNPRPSYYSQLRVDPNNEQKVWLGGVPIYMSEDGGKTFTESRAGAIHTDFHAIWIDPNNSDHLLAGSDGGVHVTFDAGRNWDYLNNIAIGQFYEVTFDNQKPYHVCGGLQDNYTWCGPSATTQQRGISNDEWITISGGDGFHARIDPSNPDIVYSESQDGNLQRRNLKTSESRNIRPEEENDKAPRYRFQWNSPLIISPHNPKTIYYGGNYLFKSTDQGDTWERLGSDLTNNADRNTLPILGKPVDTNTLSRHDGVQAWPCITAIAESPVKTGVLWTGTDDGNVQISRDGGKTWANVMSHVPGVQKGAYVSRIEPSHKDEGTAYLTFDNHRSADYAIYIYKTTNYGDSWSKIANGIPPEAGTVHAIREDPYNSKLLFAGTEFGLFVTFNAGANWEHLRNGLPTVPVFDLQIHPREHDLILATHGRSIWIMDNIRALEELDDTALTSDVKAFSPSLGIEYKIANYKGFLGANTYLAPNPPTGVTLDYYAKTGGPVEVTVKDKAGNEVRHLSARADAGTINRVVWDMRADAPLRTQTPATAQVGGRGGRGGGGRGGRGSGTEPAAVQPNEPTAENPQNAGGGGGRGGLGNRGPLVDAGEYTMTIALAGKSDQKTVAIEDDPRVTMSDADRFKRRAALTKLVTLTRDADGGRKKIVAMNIALTNLTQSWSRPGAGPVPDAVKKATDDMLAKIKAVIGLFDMERQQGQLGAAGPPPRYIPPPISQKIGRLMGAIDGYSATPTVRQLADIQQVEGELAPAIAQVNQLFDEMPRLNKMLADAGVPYFTVDVNNVPPPQQGRGGGN